MDERARDTETAEIDRFIARWAETGGAEMANAQSFINELCDLLGVPRPDGARPNEALNDYVFEKRVDHRIRGLTTAHRIDCYRRDSFILEAKQSSTEARRAAAWNKAMRAGGLESIPTIRRVDRPRSPAKFKLFYLFEDQDAWIY